MLKRKADETIRNLAEESDDNLISSKQEITQRKIFRAKRPIRSVSQNSPSKFKVSSQLLSLEEEVRLLSLDNKPKPLNVSSHHRTRSENFYGFTKFSSYAFVEPLKEIIHNFNESNESQALKGFLDSSLEKNDKIVRFSSDCNFFVDENAVKAFCKILCLRDKSAAFLSVFNKDDEVLFNKSIGKESFCKEIQGETNSIVLVCFGRGKAQEQPIKLEMNNISKHLFLRCFTECKLQSF